MDSLRKKNKYAEQVDQILEMSPEIKRSGLNRFVIELCLKRLGRIPENRLSSAIDELASEIAGDRDEITQQVLDDIVSDVGRYYMYCRSLGFL